MILTLVLVLLRGPVARGLSGEGMMIVLNSATCTVVKTVNLIVIAAQMMEGAGNAVMTMFVMSAQEPVIPVMTCSRGTKSRLMNADPTQVKDTMQMMVCTSTIPVLSVEKRHIPNNTSDEKLYKLNLPPSLNREKEKYINPSEDGWKKRYYETVFDIEYTEERLKQVTRKYLEALEWTWKYYSQYCHDWKWHYEYDYAPLVEDVLRTIPYYEFDFIKTSRVPTIHELVQLIYVLPNESHCYLPVAVRDILDIKCAAWFDKTNIQFKWEYCKYLWESHLELPYMNTDIIEKMFHMYIQ